MKVSPSALKFLANCDTVRTEVPDGLWPLMTGIAVCTSYHIVMEGYFKLNSEGGVTRLKLSGSVPAMRKIMLRQTVASLIERSQTILRNCLWKSLLGRKAFVPMNFRKLFQTIQIEILIQFTRH